MSKLSLYLLILSLLISVALSQNLVQLRGALGDPKQTAAVGQESGTKAGDTQGTDGSGKAAGKDGVTASKEEAAEEGKGKGEGKDKGTEGQSGTAVSTVASQGAGSPEKTQTEEKSDPQSSSSSKGTDGEQGQKEQPVKEEQKKEEEEDEEEVTEKATETTTSTSTASTPSATQGSEPGATTPGSEGSSSSGGGHEESDSTSAQVRPGDDSGDDVDDGHQTTGSNEVTQPGSQETESKDSQGSAPQDCTDSFVMWFANGVPVTTFNCVTYSVVYTAVEGEEHPAPRYVSGSVSNVEVDESGTVTVNGHKFGDLSKDISGSMGSRTRRSLDSPDAMKKNYGFDFKGKEVVVETSSNDSGKAEKYNLKLDGTTFYTGSGSKLGYKVSSSGDLLDNEGKIVVRDAFPKLSSSYIPTYLLPSLFAILISAWLF